MIHYGDCLNIMPTLPESSYDAIVTDPPYGLKFMGQLWDHGIPGVAYWSAALRVLKPAHYMLCFGGTRTYHRLACAIEDAGFEVRDCLMWMYGSGFPKAKSCLKPAYEPILLARKPGPKVLPLQIDACRIEGKVPSTVQGQGQSQSQQNGEMFSGPDGRNKKLFVGNTAGRWPANLILDEEAGAMLDEQSGERPSGAVTKRNPREHGYSGGWAGNETANFHATTGGASRFFASFPEDNGPEKAMRFLYSAKASKRERDAGLESMPEQPCGTMEDDAYKWQGTETHAPHNTKRRNTHCTVKPIALLRYLAKLITPPGGLVLDPFLGSGSTILACREENLRCDGIEMNAEYVKIAEARTAEKPTTGFKLSEE
jgi:site-specific DNA-methyltransferase (adenine-specific)